MERAPEIFEKPQASKNHDKEIEKMYAKIGQFEMEWEYLKKK